MSSFPCSSCSEHAVDHQPSGLEVELPFAKHKLEAVKDLTAKLTVPNKFPVALGGFSDLYRGTLRTKTGETIDVVVKVLRVKDTSESMRAYKRLCREAFLFGAAEHPFVAKFYGTAVVNSRPALVLKWYDNGDALSYLRGRTTPEKFAVVKDIATGLEYLHCKDIVHGDVKGTNVLIADSGHAILTDFGLSHFLEIRTGCTTSSSSGSIRWFAPELAVLCLPLNSDSHVALTIRARTKASDVWAFGATVFELLTGSVPYAEIKNRSAIIQNITSGVTPLMASPSAIFLPAIITILSQCWQFEVGHRPSMADVVRDLQVEG